VKPRHAADGFSLWIGHCSDLLAGLPADSVDCCVTSPPYWSLRDYDIEGIVWGGDPDHEHVWDQEHQPKAQTGGTGASTLGAESGGNAISAEGKVRSQDRQKTAPGPSFFCECGAWKGQLGLEPTPDLFVQHLVEVFAGVHRVLAPHGTCWIVIGDSYADASAPDGLKPKDLALIPHRLVIALQDWGWWVRSDVVWDKPNPMPASVTDRPTVAHEHVLMLTKQPTYYFDQEAVREPHTPDGRKKTVHDHATDGSHPNYDNVGGGRERWPNGGRNIRSVWKIPTQSFSAKWLGLDEEEHYAGFPELLAERAIQASCPREVCVRCGTPRYRIVDRRSLERSDLPVSDRNHRPQRYDSGKVGDGEHAGKGQRFVETRTIGWSECPCQIGLPPDSFAPILSPLGEADDEYDDPSIVTGRAGMNRDRNDGEGVRVMTRYEQRAYAEQLRASSHRTVMEVDAGPEAFLHYIRTDAAGARAVPEDLLEIWLARGWLERVVLPEVPPGKYRPGRVLDPFMGSGTTAVAALRHNREVWGLELGEAYGRIAVARAAVWWKRPSPTRDTTPGGQLALL